MKVIIQITRDDIRNGVQGDTWSCAIAQAFKRVGYSDTAVDDENIRFDCPKQNLHFRASTPPRVQKWIRRFDEDKVDVRPFTLRLNAESH